MASPVVVSSADPGSGGAGPDARRRAWPTAPGAIWAVTAARVQGRSGEGPGKISTARGADHPQHPRAGAVAAEADALPPLVAIQVLDRVVKALLGDPVVLPGYRVVDAARPAFLLERRQD